MDTLKITEFLGKSGIASPKIFYYRVTDSTNTRAAEYARANPENRTPAVFIADAQSAGRGRRGRSFFSEAGVGVYLSILLYPTERGADATRATARAAVALSEAVSALSPISPSIKWVNDLYAGGKKLAGILAEGEMAEDGKISRLVLGMGINVYKTTFPKEISKTATSIEAECGERISREMLVAEIIKNLLSPSLTEEEILRKYRERSFIVGREITVLKATESYEARAVEILDDYSLLIEKPDGSREKLFTGEVSTRVAKMR